MATIDERIAWLNAQIDEDELIAKAEYRPYWLDEDDPRVEPSWTDEFAEFKMRSGFEHVLRHPPLRTLREVEAARRILERHVGHDTGSGCYPVGCERRHDGILVCGHDRRRWPCADVLDVAAPYVDLPGFPEEWKS